MTHPNRQIPLCHLRAPGQPVRVTPALAAAHDELVASIRAHGLLQDLVVRAADGGTYTVVAGNRRLAALHALADHGDMAPDVLITCAVLVNGVADHEAALAENVVRVAMNRADQVTAFARLVDAGATASDIAVRFGVTTLMVERRLRLAHLAPRILDDYRSGAINEAQAQAYATTADHARQIEAYEWATEQYWSPQPGHITARLQAGMERSDSDLARFVGMDAYTAAGGNAEAALFVDYYVLSDVGLLQRLAGEQLAAIAKGLEGEWKWAEHTTGEVTYQMRTIYKQTRPTEIGAATEAEAARQAELQDLFDSYEGAEWDALDEDQQQQLAAAEKEFHAIEEAIGNRHEWAAEQKAGAGVLLYIGAAGAVARYEGLVKPGDPVPGREDPPDDDPDRGSLTPAAGAAGAAATTGSPEARKPKQRGYSQGLREAVTELRNAVLRDALCGAPDVARDLLSFNLLMSMKAGYDPDDDNAAGFHPDLPLSLRKETPPRLPVQGASAAMNGYLEAPRLDLPWFDKSKSIGELFEAYRLLDGATKDRLTAQVVAALLFSLPGDDGTRYDAHAAVEHELAPAYADELLHVDGDLWSVETMWNRLRKDQIIDECRPCLGDEWAAEAAKLKKGALAKDAAERMKAHPGWLPKGFLADAATRPEREPEGE